MGAEDSQIRNIFLNIGLLLTSLGIIIGIVLSLILYIIHQKWGLVTMPEGSIIDIYPSSLRFWDFIVVSFTVMLIGLLATLGPARRASKINTLIQEG